MPLRISRRTVYSVGKPTVYTDGNIPSVYTVDFTTTYTVRLEIRNGMVTSGDFTDGNYRGIQTVIAVQWRGAVTDGVTDGITDGRNPSVMPSEKIIICTHLPTLSSSVSPSSSFPSHLSPPKLQPNTHPKLSTILNTSTQVSYILYVVTISVSCRFYYFFVSKSILFSFNI